VPDFRHWETEERFLGYVSIHSETDRALFHETDINLLLELAGDARRVTGWMSLHSEDAKHFIARARQRGENPPDRMKLLLEG